MRSATEEVSLQNNQVEGVADLECKEPVIKQLHNNNLYIMSV